MKESQFNIKNHQKKKYLILFSDKLNTKYISLIISILFTSFIYCSSSLSTIPNRPENIPKGAIWSEKENNWMYQEETGVYSFWYPNGKKAQEARTINGKHEGLCTKWYENGNKKMEGVYKNDLAEGLWQWWWPNGQLQGKGNFVADKEESLWEAWDDNGVKLGETIYKNGVIISEKNFSKKKKE
ncbi:MAG: hypothetical protein V1874_04800 [Spirochaetota bacterium]